MIIKKYRKSYIINKVNDNSFQVCKILNEYDSIKDANADLIKLLTRKCKENDLLKKFDGKEL